MQHYYVYVVLLLILTLTALLAWPATSGSATLQLRAHLSHVDSGHSFTKGELLRRMVVRSRARAAKLCPSGSGPGSAVTVPAASDSGVIGSTEYLIHLGIGTPRPQHVALEVDTGSNVIWTQCAPCFKCFDQLFPVFNTSISDTVHSVACSDPLCQQGLQRRGRSCFLGGCAYRLAYGDKSESMGQLAKDSFTFQQGKVVPDLAFGCSQYTTGNFLSNESGIAGFGRGPLSLPGQLRVGSFSYCFTSIFESRSSPVFLGAPDDLRAHTTGPILSTPLVQVPDAAVYYNLSLKGVTVGKARLPVPESAFALKANSSGGTIIDSGTAITAFPRAVFRVLREVFVSQMPLTHIPNDDTDDEPGELQCFQTDSVRDASKVPVPKLILHLEGGADWELPRENYMAKHPNLEDQLCLVIDSAGDDDRTIIGNFQQQQLPV